jgi:transposase
MAKKSFKAYNQGQTSLFSQSPDEKLPADFPAQLANQTVDNLDITKITDTCRGGGTSCYHPRMMLKTVLFACLSHIYSCRKIDAAREHTFHLYTGCADACRYGASDFE